MMDTTVYMATYEPTTGSYELFIGIFSSSQLAQEACQQDWNTRNPEARRLLFIGLGVASTASCGAGRYEVNAIELDRRVEYQPGEY